MENCKKYLEELEMVFQNTFCYNHVGWFLKKYLDLNKEKGLDFLLVNFLFSTINMVAINLCKFFECSKDSISLLKIINKIEQKKSNHEDIKLSCKKLKKEVEEIKQKNPYQRIKTYRDKYASHVDINPKKQDFLFTKNDVDGVIKSVYKVLLELFKMTNNTFFYLESLEKEIEVQEGDFLKCLNLYPTLNQERFNCGINSHYREEKGEDRERLTLEINKNGNGKIDLVTIKNKNRNDFLIKLYNLLQENALFLKNIDIKIEKNIKEDSKYPL